MNERLQSCEDECARQGKWIAGHDAEITEKWKNQDSRTRNCITWQHDIEIRLTSLEKRVLLLCASAAFIGGGTGPLLGYFFK